MSIVLKINTKAFEEHIKNQNIRRKSWKPKLKTFWKEGLKPYFENRIKELKAETPLLTGTLRKRAVYYFKDEWKIFFGYDENIAPVPWAPDDYWRPGKSTTYRAYANYRHKQKRDFFDTEQWWITISKDIEKMLYIHWKTHWKK